VNKILVISDDGVSSGFGRISSEVNLRLMKRGYHIMAASLQYDGLLPATYDDVQLPYHVASMGGRPNWPDIVAQIINVYQPNIIMVIQDAPYSGIVRNAPLDWSKYAFVMCAPVDGAPIYPQWVETAKQADGMLTISEFGVQAWKQAGVEAGLCRPGIHHDKFYRLPDEQRKAIREKLGIAPEAFVLGMMAQNQGRKDITGTLKAFFDFALDKPTARLLMDMEEVSPAGWDIPSLCKQFGWDVSKLIFRKDCVQRGVVELRERYNVLDAHSVLAFREGFGLPILEAMACGVVSMAQDWCAGTEVLKEGRGVLIPPIDFMPSTWGGALDKLPDLKVMTEKLQWLYDNSAERAAMAERGMKWARQQTWDTAADNVIAVLEKALARKKGFTPAPETPIIKPVETPQYSPDGVNKEVVLQEAG
jgi:glycosyltransferase involved in cell wall biosynthesis